MERKNGGTLHIDPMSPLDASLNRDPSDASMAGSVVGSDQGRAVGTDGASLQHHREDSGSDFYSEDDSEGSDDIRSGGVTPGSAPASPNHRQLPSSSQQHFHLSHRHDHESHLSEKARRASVNGATATSTMNNGDYLQSVPSPNSISAAGEDGLTGSMISESSLQSSLSAPPSRLPASVRRMSQANNNGGSGGSGSRRRNSVAPAVPLSYFHRLNTNGPLSIHNEIACFAAHVCRLYHAIEKERLPWQTDFADIKKMHLPRKIKEVGGRINLNIPYYSSNYIELFYLVTMPFLFFYNPAFFVVLLVTMVMIHSIVIRRKNRRLYGDSATVLGHPISYRMLTHVLLLALALLFMFANGLRTVIWVTMLNMCVIVPHALLRRPTYFDDEVLEKCRPKLGQYAIVLLLLGLDYLEGDVSPDDNRESRRLVEQERKRLAAVLEKREGKD